jgi:hypothetical protein
MFRRIAADLLERLLAALQARPGLRRRAETMVSSSPGMRHAAAFALRFAFGVRATSKAAAGPPAFAEKDAERLGATARVLIARHSPRGDRRPK